MLRAKILTSDDLTELSCNDAKTVSAIFSQLASREIFAMRIEDVRWANCSRNKYTKDLDQLAEYVDIIETIRSLSPEEKRELDCFPLLQLQRIFETAIDQNQSYVVRHFADAMDEYRSGFASRHDEEQAIIHLLRASRILYLENRGKVFLKKDLKAKTQLLWARTLCRVQGITGVVRDDDPRITDLVNTLPVMNWSRLYGKVELKGVKGAKESKTRAKRRPKSARVKA